jgi:hypothetical protein
VVNNNSSAGHRPSFKFSDTHPGPHVSRIILFLVSKSTVQARSIEKLD